MSLRRGASIPVAGMAIAGVVAGHALTYVVAVRQPLHRSDILHATGHSYWTAAIAIAIVVGFLGAAAAGLRVLRGPGGETSGFARLAPRLALVQVCAYATIEMVERLLSGVPVGELADHHDLLPIGAAVQLVVALGGALLLHLLARTVHLVARALRAPVPRRPSERPAPAPRPFLALRSRALRSAWGLRGPPGAFAPVIG